MLQCSTLSRFDLWSYSHWARKITPLWFCPPQTSTPQLQKAQAPKSLSIFAHIFQRTKVFAFCRAHQRSFSSLWRHVISWALKPERMITGLYREQWRHQRSRKPRYTNLWCHLGILRKQNNVGVAVKNLRIIIRKWCQILFNGCKNKIYSTFALPTFKWRSAILVKLDNTVIQYFIQEIKQKIYKTQYLSKGDIYRLSGEGSATRRLSFGDKLHWVPCV